MSDGLIISDAAHRHALQRLAATSKRTSVEVLKQEAKLAFTLVARMTPPASQGVTGRAAERQGKNKVRGDIRSLYGSLGGAYDTIRLRGGLAQAKAFWKAYQDNDRPAADQILRRATGGKGLHRFDGGALHRRMRGSRGAVTSRPREPLFFVDDLHSLDAYIEQRAGNVWWLAGGWLPALQGLGGKIPYGIGLHRGPGRLRISTLGGIEITAINQVRYASEVRDIDRRIRSALRIRSAVLQRRWDAYLKRRAASTLKIT